MNGILICFRASTLFERNCKYATFKTIFYLKFDKEIKESVVMVVVVVIITAA